MSKIVYITVGKAGKQAKFTHQYSLKKREEGVDITHLNIGYSDAIPEVEAETVVVKYCTFDDEVKKRKPSFLEAEKYFHFFKDLISSTHERIKENVGEFQCVNSPEGYVISRHKYLSFLELSKIPDVHNPKTILLEASSKETFDDFLDKQRRVCIKPVMGFHGRGITSVRKVGEDYEVITNLNIVDIFNSSFEKFERYILDNKRFNDFLNQLCCSGMVVQEFIEGRKYKGKSFDVRSIRIFDNIINGARVSDTIATNLHLAGDPLSSIKSLEDLLEEECINERIIEKIEHTTKIIASTFKMNYIGADSYIDREGTPIVLEVNPLPGTMIPLKLGVNPMHLELDSIIKRAYNE